MTSITKIIIMVLLIGIISVCYCKDREGDNDDSDETLNGEES